jgi:tRNA(fMet)-specific endonuclease VapC
MKFLLDTNVCIRYISGRSPSVREQVRSLNAEDVAVSAIVKAELYWGAARSNRPKESVDAINLFTSAFKSLPFDDSAAGQFGILRADLFRRGQPIGPYDMQIAAIALANDLILVTHNTAEFKRVKDLRLEDWEA